MTAAVISFQYFFLFIEVDSGCFFTIFYRFGVDIPCEQ